MKKISLEKLPNQSLRTRLDDRRYQIIVKALNSEIMSISISCNEVLLAQNIRAVPNTLLLPKHFQTLYGNFCFITIDDEYPYYERFGENHALYYLSDGEL